MTSPVAGDREECLSLYRMMVRIRLFEEQVGKLVATGQVPGLTHLSTGQEAVAAGVCAALRPHDYLFSGHRAHGHTLAKGSPVAAGLAEILGREPGLCRGRGGSMHLVDASRGMLGATGVVGGNIPLALGAAWAAQARGEDRLAVVFFGDGASGNGVFHESLNLASLWRLPVLFVCENNGVAEFTQRAEHSRVALTSEFAKPYDIPVRVVDGNDVLAVYTAAQELTRMVRQACGPAYLECQTYRLSGHYVGDAQAYRNQAEVAAWRERDPLLRLQRQLLAQGVPSAQLTALEAAERDELALALQQAWAAPPPAAAAAGADVYSSAWLAQACP
ncbi:MAG: thiamine pyrophosphate-dependent dehydrogenase E1 component subunit alpha [Alicyclobacillus sp.]|nr:thiamine pyrophosphate-dependent dehydrogenase E1 component subunit alpha [Alicyclobacillus sp.]